MKNKETNGAMAFFGFGLVFFAPAFLFNPDFTLLDLLPDCIGYLLLTISLRKLRDLNSYFERAASGFFKAAIVTLLKLMSFFGINAVCDEMNAKTWNLLLLFGFGIGELLLLVPAWNAFFEGWVYIGFSYPKNKKGKTTLDRMRGSMLRFLFAKQVITVLPEISVLSEHRFLENGEMPWYEFTSMFRVFAIFALLIIGIVWLCRMYRFLRQTAAQTEMFAAMEADYRTRVVKKTGIFEVRKISLTLLFGAAAAFASCDVVLDNINLLPDVLCAILLCLFFVFTPYAGKKRVPGIVLSGFYAALTLLGDYFVSEFRSTGCSLVMVQTEPKAWKAFWKYYPFRIADTALLCILTLLVLLTLGKLTKDHCGYVSDDVTEHYRVTKLAEIRHGLRVKCGVCVFFTVLARAADFCCDYVRTLNGTIIGDLMGLLTLLLSVLSAVFFLRYAFAIYDNAKLKYMIS